MFVTIDLRDNENMSVKSVKFEIQAGEKMIDLQHKITSEFGIDLSSQMIFDKNDRRIDIEYKSIENAGVQNDDTLVLKHGNLDWWIMYKKYADLVLQQHFNKVDYAKRAVRFHEILTTAGFFEFYPQYDNFQREKQPEIASWTEGDVVLIRKATEDYFHNLHDQKRGDEESEFVCYFKELDEEFENRTSKTLAFVRIHGEESVTKYNIKWHYYEGSRVYEVPDVTELYISILLGLIGAGPKSHIIPRTMWYGTKTSTYIANQWDDDNKFESLGQIFDENTLSADLLVQMTMLCRLLYIRDFGEQNCGRWKGTENLAIIDFAPKDNFNVYSDIKYELTSHYVDLRWGKAYLYVKNRYDDNSWLKIVKVYFDKWDIASKIELAREQFDPTKTLLKTSDMSIKHPDRQDTYTEQIDEYIDILYENLENLKTLLNSIE